MRGAPSVGLYIKRGARVFLWDGRQPVAAGDRLRLKVVPEGFTHVGVFATAASSSEQARLLFASEIAPEEETLLPRAWEVDDTSGAETLVVVLGRRPVSKKDLTWLGQNRQHPSELWIRTLHLRKSAGPPDSIPDSGLLEGEP